MKTKSNTTDGQNKNGKPVKRWGIMNPHTADTPTLVTSLIVRDPETEEIDIRFFLSPSFVQAVADAEEVEEVDDELADLYVTRCMESCVSDRDPPFEFQVLPFHPGITDSTALPFMCEAYERTDESGDKVVSDGRLTKRIQMSESREFRVRRALACALTKG